MIKIKIFEQSKQHSENSEIPEKTGVERRTELASSIEASSAPVVARNEAETHKQKLEVILEKIELILNLIKEWGAAQVAKPEVEVAKKKTPVKIARAFESISFEKLMEEPAFKGIKSNLEKINKQEFVIRAYVKSIKNKVFELNKAYPELRLKIEIIIKKTYNYMYRNPKESEEKGLKDFLQKLFFLYTYVLEKEESQNIFNKSIGHESIVNDIYKKYLQKIISNLPSEQKIPTEDLIDLTLDEITDNKHDILSFLYEEGKIDTNIVLDAILEEIYFSVFEAYYEAGHFEPRIFYDHFLENISDDDLGDSLKKEHYIELYNLMYQKINSEIRNIDSINKKEIYTFLVNKLHIDPTRLKFYSEIAEEKIYILMNQLKYDYYLPQIKSAESEESFIKLNVEYICIINYLLKTLSAIKSSYSPELGGKNFIQQPNLVCQNLKLKRRILFCPTILLKLSKVKVLTVSIYLLR